jgi:hypothetical protein
MNKLRTKKNDNMKEDILANLFRPINDFDWKIKGSGTQKIFLIYKLMYHPQTGEPKGISIIWVDK